MGSRSTRSARWVSLRHTLCSQGLSAGEGQSNRKDWIENGFNELAQIFAVTVAGFSVLNNHLRVLARLDRDAAAGWSGEEVARRWGRLRLSRGKTRRVLPVSDQWVQDRLAHPAWVSSAHEQLRSLGCLIKSLKEPLARLANREDDPRGAFFEERFKSIAVLDEQALLAISACVDLIPATEFFRSA